MPTNQPTSSYLSLFNLDRAASLPLHRQIYDGLRRAILNERLKVGSRLPSTRELAASLSVSRNTVMNAFDQLLAEGYLETRVGAGTFVSEQMPQELLRGVGQEIVETAVSPESERPLSQRGERYRQVFIDYFRPGGPRQAFATFPISTPDLSLFPFATWARLTARRQKSNPAQTFARSGNIAGYWPLRVAISEHLKLSRAVQCQPEQIFVTAGSQQALYLAGQVLLDPGDEVWVENPGYLGVRSALL
ncbi:MAG: PLP-dependent aminotransferase family protein, partial [Anaerolineae bacterium]